MQKFTITIESDRPITQGLLENILIVALDEYQAIDMETSKVTVTEAASPSKLVAPGVGFKSDLPMHLRNKGNLPLHQRKS